MFTNAVYFFTNVLDFCGFTQEFKRILRRIGEILVQNFFESKATFSEVYK